MSTVYESGQALLRWIVPLPEPCPGEEGQSPAVGDVPQAVSAATWWVVARYLDSALSWH